MSSSVSRFSRDLFQVEGASEGLVCKNVGAGFAAQLVRSAEVIEMRMGNDGGVDISDLVAGVFQPGDQRVPRLRARKAGVDYVLFRVRPRVCNS